MGKKGLSDKVRSKQKNKTKQAPNPFEVKVNKVKHSVVNKNLQKWEKGIPGVSRSKAVKKRKDTLLKELHHMKKTNSLLDKRFGENDSTLSADDKMVQRFALEKKKQMKKGDFSLNEEEEVLTHYGQSLVENLKDNIGSESEDEDGDGKLRMGEFQFGGFSKGGDEVSWKDKMNQVIADSRKQKYERQAEKEKTLETTKELDSNWKSLVPNLKPVHNNQAGKKATPFMLLFHNLVMEQKSAGATDKLKTEEEKAQEEAERLKQLEAQRIARMQGKSKQTKITHTSADDLNDGFAFEKPKQSVTFAGQPGSEDESDGRENSQDLDVENKEEADTSGEDDNEEEDDDDEEEDDDDEEEDDSDSDDSYSDLASENESDNDEAVKQVEKTPKPKKESKPKSILKKTEASDANSQDVDSSSLAFVYTAPGSYSELRSLLHGHAADEQSTILSRLRKCHHPSLAEGNKEKLETIQQYILQYYGDIVKQCPVDKVLVNHVVLHLWGMTQLCKMSSAIALQNLLLEHHKEYTAQTEKKDGRGTYPGIDTLMYLRLVECLFPTSDFQHPVTTPALHFITQMLSECVIRNNRDVVAGLFLCSLALKFVGLSKRYVPEVVTFLHGLLYLGAEKDAVSDMKAFPPLRVGSKTVDLCARQQCSSVSEEWSVADLLSKDLTELNGDQFRCEVMDRCLDSLLVCMKLWEDLPCLAFIIEPCMKPLSLLPKHLYPVDMQTKIQELSQKLLDAKSKTLKVMQQPSKKPVPLKLFEPEIQEFWSGKRKKGGPNKDANERQRLNHKYKREMKAAIREVRRDNEVLARHQLETVLQKDAERKRKTNELLHSLASQEGDFKAIKKMKK